jgi:O-antigen/teichoic acid export membrane protein
MLRKILSHATIYGLSAQLPRLVGVLTLPVITQFLTPLDYGVAGVVTAYAAIFNVLHTLGMSVVMVNAFAKQPKRYQWIWRQLHGFLLVWSLVYGLLMAIGIYLAVPHEAEENRLTIALLYSLPTMFFTSTEMQANFFHQLSQKPLPLALKSFIVAVVGVGLNIYTIAYLKMGYMGWFYSIFISLVVGFAFNSYSAYFKEGLWPIFSFRWYRIKQSLKVSLPVIPHHMAGYLLDTSDRLVLSVLGVSTRQIGLYNVASSFGTYFQIATFAVSQAASPFYMQYFGQQDSLRAAREARKLTFYLQAIFLMVTSLICLWMREIFIFLIRNDDLRQAYPLAIVILMGYNYRPMYNAVTNYLIYKEYSNRLWKVSLAAGAANVLLNFVMIPIFGFEVAAFTTFGALMYMGYAGFYLKEFRDTTLVNYYPLRWLGVTVISLVLVYFMVELNLDIKAIITALVGMLVALLIFKERKLLFRK